jgi:hypothetical protein
VQSAEVRGLSEEDRKYPLKLKPEDDPKPISIAIPIPKFTISDL